MKLFVRLAALVLAVMMVLAVSIASADYSVPSKSSQIEGLPEMPEVPTMTTKGDGQNTTTVTMSEAPAWMSAVYNWQWVDMTFDENNTAVVDHGDGKSQLGTGHGGGAWRDTEWHCYTYWYDQGFAYDGETQDGVHVRYGRFGECVAITVTVEGANYFNNDVAPSKVEVTFKPLNVVADYWGVFTSNWYVANITETYDEGDIASISADYAEAKGGKLLHVDVKPAE